MHVIGVHKLVSVFDRVSSSPILNKYFCNVCMYVVTCIHLPYTVFSFNLQIFVYSSWTIG